MAFTSGAIMISRSKQTGLPMAAYFPKGIIYMLSNISAKFHS